MPVTSIRPLRMRRQGSVKLSRKPRDTAALGTVDRSTPFFVLHLARFHRIRKATNAFGSLATGGRVRVLELDVLQRKFIKKGHKTHENHARATPKQR
jgi:hypothetical protein